MSYKRFDNEDVVVSAESVTAPCWSNNVVNLQVFELNSTQTAATSGKYYYNVYNTGSEVANSAIQFSVAHGNKLGLGAPLYDTSVTGKSYSSTVYGQFRTLIFGDEDTNFTFTSGTTTRTPENVLFISVESFKSLSVLNPVESIIGFFFFATYSIRFTSVISGDAILYAGHFKVSKKSTEELSKTEANQGIFFLLRSFVILEIHGQGVKAFLYKE